MSELVWETTVEPVCWATIVPSGESEGNTNTQTTIVNTKSVLQLLLEPLDAEDLIQLSALSSSSNGD